jgi:crotonobetainyl-CoA:carnitine CoA-transferase CaiB-like acyl-CoA transferase
MKGRKMRASVPLFQAASHRAHDLLLLVVVDAAVAAATAKLSRADIFERLAAGGVPCGAVQDLREVMNDPHLLATGALFAFDHPDHGSMTLNRGAIRFPSLERAPYRPSAALGSSNARYFPTKTPEAKAQE